MIQQSNYQFTKADFKLTLTARVAAVRQPIGPEGFANIVKGIFANKYLRFPPRTHARTSNTTKTLSLYTPSHSG